MKVANKLYIVSIVPILLFSLGMFISYTYYFNEVKKTEQLLNFILKKESLILEIYRKMGYGNGIHAFKNYIIRGNISYAQRAKETLEESIKLINHYRQFGIIDTQEENALNTLEVTINDYLEKLSIGVELKKNGLSIKEIDSQVKVDDLPAITFLNIFQNKFNLMREVSLKKIHKAQYNMNIYLILIPIFSIFIALWISNKFTLGIVNSLNNLGALIKNVSVLNQKEVSPEIIENIEENEIKEIALTLQTLSNELNQTINKLKKSNEDLEHFSFVTAHELQEPIKLISNYTDFLEMESIDNLNIESQDYVKKIKKLSSKMHSLVQILLKYSRMANQKANDEIIDLNILIEKLLKDLKHFIHEKKAQIKVPTLPKVKGDPELIKITFENLLKNSLNSQSIEPLLKINISVEELNEKRYIINIRDNGETLDKRSIEKVLLSFGNRKDIESHFGIDLATCKRILASHNSDLKIESIPNVGTCYSFTLESV